MGLKQSIQKVRRSTFQISVNIAEGNQLHTPVLGTAFSVGDRHAITAGHVLDSVAKLHKEHDAKPQLAFAGLNVSTPEMEIRANFVGRPFGVVDVDAENDLALLETSPMDSYNFSVGGMQAQPPVPIKLREGRPDEGEMVACSGYPLSEPSLVTTVGYVASSWAFNRAGKRMTDRYLADLTANPGNSGGPVYRAADGKAIGVLVAGRLTDVVDGDGLHSAGIAELIPAMTVAALMRKHNVEPS